MTKVGEFLEPQLPEAWKRRDGEPLWGQSWLRSRVQLPRVAVGSRGQSTGRGQE